MTYNMPVGTSEPQDFQLHDHDVNLDGTDWDVSIVFSKGTPAGAVLVVAWLDQAAGTVRVLGAETLPVGHHKFRFKLTDGLNVGFAPNGEEPDEWHVVKV